MYINVRISISGEGEGHTWFTLGFSFTIHDKITRTRPILQSNSTSFSSNFFSLGRIVKKLRKGSEYSSFH